MAVGDSSLGFSHQMEDSGRIIRVSVIWKGKTYTLLIDSGTLLKDFGHELKKLTGVKEETLRLIVPRLNEKGSRLIFPFSDDHSSLSLQEASITEDKPIRMMGVSKDELDGVLRDATTDMRILGFEEEERRRRQKRSYGPNSSIKLPQGAYIFCDFRTLQIPGIELNPPPSEALKRMHMLAADPGIIAIMNKHRWRVGIMTELAPVGYVGVSPQCILGFNKNHGEEISLRLRTDDLKGFRKYERIKKTLLHELAHMVYSEHDENFYALDRQLNQEADSLDWTKSRGHTLTGTNITNDYEEDHLFDENEQYYQRLGGNQSDYLENARESSVAAAYRRFSHTTGDNVGESKLSKEPDPDNLATVRDETEEPNLPKALSHSWSKLEPDPDDTIEDFAAEMYSGHSSIQSNSRDASAPEHNSEVMEIESDRVHPVENDDEPDPDDLEACPHIEQVETTIIPKDTVMFDGGSKRSVDTIRGESNPGDTVNEAIQTPSDPNNGDPSAGHSPVVTGGETIIEAYEPDPDDQEMQRIQDSVTIISNRLMKSVDALKAEVIPSEVTNVLQTLLRIVRNIIGQPHEMKFKRLRKGNPAIKRNIINYAAAVEILSLVGFVEEMVFESGAEEAYLVLKRNDPGLLWIAKSIIESHTGS